jgi:hypothetical protein
MPTLPTSDTLARFEPLMISEPDQVIAAVDNLLELERITPAQARMLRLLARQPSRVHVGQWPARRMLYVQTDNEPPRYVLSTGKVRWA